MKRSHKIKDEIYKLVYKMTHAKSYWHNRKRWPRVKIERKCGREITKLSYNKNEITLINPNEIRNKYSGSILLTATGPSVNDIKFKNKNSIHAMGVNGAIYLKPHIDFSFYVITDIHFPDHKPELIEEITKESKITLFATIDVIAKIIEKIGYQNIKCSFVAIEDLTDKIYQKKLNISELIANIKNKKNFYASNEVGFSSDITDGIFPAKTVIYWALQIIAHLGFDTIYIVGLDMNNFDKPRFYENEKNKIHTQLEQDRQSIMAAFKHASYVFKNNLNIKVINLSINSSISDNIFEKSEYNKYFD